MFFLPNPDSKAEMAVLGAGMFAFQMVRAAASVSNIYGVVMWAVAVYLMVVAIVCAIALYCLYLGVTQLIRIYRQHAFTGSQCARILWGAAAVFSLLCIVAYALCVQPETYAVGLIVFSWSLLAFVLVCTYINWRAAGSRAVFLRQNVTLQNVVSWHKTKQQAQP